MWSWNLSLRGVHTVLYTMSKHTDTHTHIYIYIYLFIYLLEIYLIPVTLGRHASVPRLETRRKEKERRINWSGQKAKRSTPTQAIDTRIGEEERNRKQKEEKKKETETEPPIQFYILCLGFVLGLPNNRNFETVYTENLKNASWTRVN